MSIEAMKQALEALKYHQEKTRPINMTQNAIATLSQAIEQAEKQQALDKKADNARELGLSYEPEEFVRWSKEKEFFDAAHALPQAEKQEPVAYIDHVSGKPKFIDGYVVQTDYDIPLYTAPPKSDNELYAIDKSINEEIERLKTEINRFKELAEYRLKLLMKMPEQAEWVGLTDDDLRQIILASIGVAEAKLKEKNNG